MLHLIQVHLIPKRLHLFRVPLNIRVFHFPPLLGRGWDLRAMQLGLRIRFVQEIELAKSGIPLHIFLKLYLCLQMAKILDFLKRLRVKLGVHIWVGVSPFKELFSQQIRGELVSFYLTFVKLVLDPFQVQLIISPFWGLVVFMAFQRILVIWGIWVLILLFFLQN